MWVEFTCSHSHAFPTLISSSSSLSSLRVLEKELKFGSAADENYYSGGERKQYDWEFKEQLGWPSSEYVLIISAEILKHLVTMYFRLAFNSINKETFNL